MTPAEVPPVIEPIDTNFRSARQRFHCSCFTKRSLLQAMGKSRLASTRRRKKNTQCAASTSGESTASKPSTSQRSVGQQRRPTLLMRRWLQKQADDGEIPGLEWIDEDRTLLRIPWCHGLRSEWSQEHSVLFRSWAEYKGLSHHHQHYQQQQQLSINIARIKNH